MYKCKKIFLIAEYVIFNYGKRFQFIPSFDKGQPDQNYDYRVSQCKMSNIKS